MTKNQTDFIMSSDRKIGGGGGGGGGGDDVTRKSKSRNKKKLMRLTKIQKQNPVKLDHGELEK